MKKAGYINDGSKPSIEDPGYQVFHRAKKEMSPEAYQEWLEFVERAKRMFDNGKN